jgi:hypothetical protein
MAATEGWLMETRPKDVEWLILLIFLGTTIANLTFMLFLFTYAGNSYGSAGELNRARATRPGFGGLSR